MPFLQLLFILDFLIIIYEIFKKKEINIFLITLFTLLLFLIIFMMASQNQHPKI